MVATSSLNKTDKLTALVSRLKTDYQQFRFKSGSLEHWSPATQTIIFNTDHGRAGLLHELAHALLAHQNYETDFELLQLEAKAWRLTAELAAKYGVRVSQNHVQKCLDSYRDWLHKRARCPVCSQQGVQQDPRLYRCLNCQANWTVTSNKFVRPYRRSQTKNPA